MRLGFLSEKSKRVGAHVLVLIITLTLWAPFITIVQAQAPTFDDYFATVLANERRTFGNDISPERLAELERTAREQWARFAPSVPVQQQMVATGENRQATDALQASLRERFAGEGGDGVTCSTWQGFLSNFITCNWRNFMAAIGGLLMGLAGLILGIVSLAFNFLLDFTILQFGSFYNSIAENVEFAWSSVRDLGQIAIIAGFVFVAFATIFGVEQYGARQFAAKLIVVALIINFSLFITKSIINASNFTATQFLAPIVAREVAVTGTPGDTTIDVGTFSQDATFDVPAGVGGAFIQSMGIASVWDTNAALKKVAEQAQSGWAALAYGLTSALIFLGAAVVLAYGSWLLLVRAVSLIALLIGSALALATFAIPKFNIIWSYWWKLLLTNAIFAPLLAILLWGTMTIVQGMQDNKSLGNLAFTPENPVAIEALVNYLIILGLLYASFRISRAVSLITVGAGNEQRAMRYGKWAGRKGLGILGGAFGFIGGLAAANRVRLWQQRAPGGAGGVYGGASAGARQHAARQNLRQMPANVQNVVAGGAGRGAAGRPARAFSAADMARARRDAEDLKPGKDGVRRTATDEEREKTASDTALREIGQEEKMGAGDEQKPSGRGAPGIREKPAPEVGAGDEQKPSGRGAPGIREKPAPEKSADDGQISATQGAETIARKVHDIEEEDAARKAAEAQGRSTAQQTGLARESQRTSAAHEDTVLRSYERRQPEQLPKTDAPPESGSAAERVRARQGDKDLEFEKDTQGSFSLADRIRNAGDERVRNVFDGTDPFGPDNRPSWKDAA